jgi:hypothetical protein
MTRWAPSLGKCSGMSLERRAGGVPWTERGHLRLRGFPDARRVGRCKPRSHHSERGRKRRKAARGYRRHGSSRPPGTCTDESCERAGAAGGCGLRVRVSGAPCGSRRRGDGAATSGA